MGGNKCWTVHGSLCYTLTKYNYVAQQETVDLVNVVMFDFVSFCLSLIDKETFHAHNTQYTRL